MKNTHNNKFRGLSRVHLTMFALVMLALPAASFGGVFLSVAIAPPALPVYVQPICPGPGYIWTPGYWGYGPDGYYWVPGTWVAAPYVGALWTPGYWGWSGGLYVWNAGYWGPHIGFYGGVNYGFGYGGVGYEGGYWHNGVFAYNTTVSRVDVTTVHNTYSRTVVNNNVSSVSYNGGKGGITARPNATERAAASEHHTAATSAQTQHEHAASTNRAQLASVNHGHPSVTASSRPGSFASHNAASPAHAASTQHTASAAHTNTPGHTNTAAHTNTQRGNTAGHSMTQGAHQSPSHASAAAHTSAPHASTASRPVQQSGGGARAQSAPHASAARAPAAHAPAGGGHHK